MKTRKKCIINYMAQPDEVKKMTSMLKAGNFRRVSDRKKAAFNMERNRRVLVASALILVAIGAYYLFF